MKSHRRFDQRTGQSRTAHRRSRTSNETPTARSLVRFSDPQRRQAAVLDFVRQSAPDRHEAPPWRPFARFILMAVGAPGRRVARFILLAGGASAAAVFLIHFLASRATYGWDPGAPGPVSLILGPVIGISLTRLYTQSFEPLDPTLTRRLTVYGVLTAGITLGTWRLMLLLPHGTDSLGLLLGFVLGVTLTWVCARFFRNP